MKMTVCAVFDVAAGIFARPIFVASVGAGVRMFADEVNRDAKDNVMFCHPQDFQLFKLGVFDDSSGLFELVERPERLAGGPDVMIRPVDERQLPLRNVN